MSLLVTLLCVLVVAASLRYLLWTRHRREGEPPLVQSWIPFFGSLFQYSKCPPKFLLDLQKKYGDVFTVFIYGKYYTFLMDPQMFPPIIRNKKTLNFHEFSLKFSSITFDHPHMQDPVLGVPNESVLRLYVHLQGAELLKVTNVAMEKIQEVILRELQEAFSRKGTDGQCWRSNSLFSFCLRIVLEVSFVTLYGTSGDPETDRRLCDELMVHFQAFDKMLPLISAGVPVWLLGSTKRHRAVLKRELTHEKLSRRRNVSALVRERMKLWDENRNLQESHKAGLHLGLLWGSITNTASAFFWSFYYVLRCPRAQQALRDEVDAAVRTNGGAPLKLSSPLPRSREQLNGMPLLSSAVNESLRLTSAPMNIRVAMEDLAIVMDNGFTLKLRKGDIVSFSLQTLHADPEIYEDPEVYKFDRFVEDGKEKTSFYKRGQRLHHYLMPFGSGISICPGRFFALTEVKDFLYHMLALLDAELYPEKSTAHMDMSRVGLGILLPKSDVQFRYRLRSHIGSASA